MGGIFRYIPVFTWEVGFKPSEKLIKTDLVVQLGCLVLGVTMFSIVLLQDRTFSPGVQQQHSSTPKNFPVMGRLSLSGPLCE